MVKSGDVGITSLHARRTSRVLAPFPNAERAAINCKFRYERIQLSAIGFHAGLTLFPGDDVVLLVKDRAPRRVDHSAPDQSPHSKTELDVLIVWRAVEGFVEQTC